MRALFARSKVVVTASLLVSDADEDLSCAKSTAGASKCELFVEKEFLMSAQHEAALMSNLERARKAVPWGDRIPKDYYAKLGEILIEFMPDERIHTIATGNNFTKYYLVALTEHALICLRGDAHSYGANYWDPADGVSVCVEWSESWADSKSAPKRVDVALFSRSGGIVIHRCLVEIAGQLINGIELAKRRWRTEGFSVPLECFHCVVNYVRGDLGELEEQAYICVAVVNQKFEIRRPDEDSVICNIPYDRVMSLDVMPDQAGYPQLVIEGVDFTLWGTIQWVNHHEATEMLTRLNEDLHGSREGNTHKDESEQQNPSDGLSVAKRLKQLEVLKTEGLISESDYEAKRISILDSL